MADKSELLKAASKLKNAKKRKATDSDEVTKSAKPKDDADKSKLAGNIANAVKRFKGDD